MLAFDRVIEVPAVYADALYMQEHDILELLMQSKARWRPFC